MAQKKKKLTHLPFRIFCFFAAIKIKIMKIIKLLCCLLLVSTTAFCQKSEFHVNIAKKIVGKNLINDTYIEGVEYIFPDKIHEYFIDSTMNYLISFQLIKKLL